MHFRVLVPKGVHAGQTIRVRCPDGSMGDVKIPKGLNPGDTFIFEMSVPDENAVKEAQKTRTTGSGSSSAAGGGGNGGGRGQLPHVPRSGGAGAIATAGGASVAGTAISAAATTSSIPSHGCGFLDREIVDTRDFIAALGVGMLIGVSIVSGFLVGVLMVTEPDL